MVRDNELKHFYQELYLNSFCKIRCGQHGIDHLIDLPHDNRFGLTLLIRPSIEVKNKIQKLLQELQKVDDCQYYYPDSDIHITVLSIISCYSGFNLDRIFLPDYILQIEKSLAGIKPFIISYNGITASESSVMISGYPDGTALETIRDRIRANFKDAHLEQSIDKRYKLKTAHSTVVRFRKEINNKESFLQVMENFRNVYLGEFIVKEFELVYNDWYHRNASTKKLRSFTLS